MKTNFATTNSPYWIELDCGIWVHLTELHQFLTYRYILTPSGIATCSTQEAINGLREEFARVSQRFEGKPKPLHILGPDPIPYTFALASGQKIDTRRIAYVSCLGTFESPLTLEPKFPKDDQERLLSAFQHSELVVGWFQDTWGPPDSDVLEGALKELSWKALAVDASD